MIRTTALLVCALLLTGCSLGGTPTPPPPPAGTGSLTVTGRVVVIGNEPFTALAISTADNVTYELTGDKAGELRALQGVTIEVTGRPAGKGQYAAQAVEVVSFRRAP